MTPHSIRLPAGWVYRRIAHGPTPIGKSASAISVFADALVAIATREGAP